MSFSSAVHGGMQIGLATLLNARLFSRITGVSGFLAAAFRFDVSAVLFLLGLLLSGLLAQTSITAPVDSVSPISASVSAVSHRLLPFAFLVGFGARLANGCTSGHGVCGVSRLRLRSIVAVLIFMAAGVISAAFITTAPSSSYSSATVAAPGFPIWVTVIAVLLCVFIPLPRLSRKHSVIEAIAQIPLGMLFGHGIVTARMNEAENVRALLKFQNFDVIGVFAGALPVAFFGMRSIESAGNRNSDKVDWKLVTGAVLFGLGWGATGICPAPALVVTGMQWNVNALTQLAAISAGIAAGEAAVKHLRTG